MLLESLSFLRSGQRMLRKPAVFQHELEMVSLEDLVPQGHLLRKIDKHIDFSFIRSEVEHLYCANNGRPALDPICLFKCLFVGYLYGIRSERQLIKDIEVNVAYRWFVGLGLTDKVPDASTFSQNRRRRFSESDIYQKIFDEVVRQAMKAGLVGGKVLYTDSTHLKANANKARFDVKEVSSSALNYLDDLNQAVDNDRAKHGKKRIKRSDDDHEPPTTEKKISRTDPDSGYMVREGKPKGFFYLDHRTVDAKDNIITDTHITPASVHDSIPYLSRLDEQQAKFGFEVQSVGLDAGYFTASLCHGLESRSIYAVMGYRRPNKPKGMMAKRLFRYDESNDIYTCPQGQRLSYSTTDRRGYRAYKSNPNHCKSCPLLSQCTRNKQHVKSISRHVWEGAKEVVNARRLTPKGKKIYARRKETVERSFADAKQLHGYRYARMRGLEKVKEQCLLTAACQNMKKVASRLWEKNKAQILVILSRMIDTCSRMTFINPTNYKSQVIKKY